MSKTLVKADRLHELKEKLVIIKGQGMGLVYEMGGIFKEIRDKELWKAGYGSFAEFYGDSELGYDKSQVNRSIKIVEKFELGEVVHVPLGKVYAILPYVTDENKKDLLLKAKVLSRSDLRYELVIPEVGGGRTAPKTYPCSACGRLRGIGFDDLCHCGWTKDQIQGVGKLIDKIEIGGSA